MRNEYLAIKESQSSQRTSRLEAYHFSFPIPHFPFPISHFPFPISHFSSLILHFSFFISLSPFLASPARAQLQHAPMAAVFALKAAGAPQRGSTSTWGQLTLTAAATYTIAAATTYTLKQTISERRPDNSDHRSFPSGHATCAFAGATMLAHEWGHLSPWVTIGGYALATAVASHRLASHRHHLHDVSAGAAIGTAATELTYWLKRKWLKRKNIDLSFTGQQLNLAIRW